MLDPDAARRILGEALRNGGDLAEIYLEDRTSLSLELEESKIERALRGADRGAGIRVFYGDTAAYAYTDDLATPSLLRAARATASVAKGSSRTRVLDFTRFSSLLEFPIEKPFDSLSEREKAELLHRIDQVARGYDPRVSQVQAGYLEYRQQVWIYNSQGLWAEDDRKIVEIRIVVMAQDKGVIQTIHSGIGAQSGLELFERIDPLAEAQELAQSAVRMLDARPAPAGEMPVVMSNAWGGVLFHEACGHALEADFINQGSSVFAGRVGEKVASSLITLIDDSTLPARRGSFRFDDDGTPSQPTVLIEQGVLKGYMWDLAEARKTKAHSTGNGRRESFRYLPLPRMTNTFIAPGDRDPEEIIGSVKRGLYVKRLGGGQADVAKGDFVFSVTEGYLIEDGKITAPIRGANLVGNGPAILSEIDMVGSDFEMDKGFGRCGKGQMVPVGVGQPTLRIPKIIVGGTE